MKFAYLLLTISSLTCVQINAQAIKVALSPALDTVQQGAVMQLSFTFENIRDGRFQLPELVGLRAIMGPSTQMQTSIMNGRRSSSKTYVYRVVADQSGLAYVPALSRKLDGKEVSSEALQCFVTADPTYIPLLEREQRAAEPDRPQPKFPTVRM